MPASSTIFRLGQTDNTGDPKELFLKKFSGEVITLFKMKNVMLPLQTTRTIQSGKSAQFPVIGQGAAAYHIPGENILDASNGYLTQIRKGERIIAIDNELIAPRLIASIDEAQAHYEYRRPYVEDMARALAETTDRNLMRVTILAARVAAGALFQDSPGGSVITSANFGTVVADTVDAFFAMAEDFDDKDVPEDNRHMVVGPATYNLLHQNAGTGSITIDRDYGGDRSGGSIARRGIMWVAGFQVHKSNRIENLGNATGYTANYEANVPADSRNDYAGDFSTTKACALHRGAVGTVKLLDLSMEMDYKSEFRATLMNAAYAMGHGILRPESAGEIKTA